MSGGYQIGPDGVLVRPAQYAADTYTKPELPEEAKENTERGAELSRRIRPRRHSRTRGIPATLSPLQVLLRPELGSMIQLIDSVNTVYTQMAGSMVITSSIDRHPIC